MTRPPTQPWQSIYNLSSISHETKQQRTLCLSSAAANSLTSWTEQSLDKTQHTTPHENRHNIIYRLFCTTTYLTCNEARLFVDGFETVIIVVQYCTCNSVGSAVKTHDWAVSSARPSPSLSVLPTARPDRQTTLHFPLGVRDRNQVAVLKCTLRCWAVKIDQIA